ncbi:MAG: hypothetical protein KQJ78_20475 [Deltaproteobacteria bacterium]|nr:hypothetical protein [Deltaproteobacteria bacterium]
MNKEEVLSLLVKNLKKAIPEFADEELDTTKSYVDLGVSSLELVEVVTRTAKELGLNLSFKELGKVKTTDDLAEVLLRLQPKA